MARGRFDDPDRAEEPEEPARLCELARRKFSRRAAERLAATIDGVSSADRLAEVGNWIIDCGTEAEFLARAQPGG